MRRSCRGLAGVSLLLLSVLLLVGAACRPSTSPSSGDKPRVVAMTTLLADLVKQVAGDRAEVVSIAPAGAEIEDYAPSPEDIRRISGARVAFVNGLDLDQWADDLLRGAGGEVAVVVLTEGLPDLEENPHMWFDLALARRYVEKIRDGLAVADPQGAEDYRRRASEYAGRLTTLESELRATLSAIPQSRRKLVTSHDAFPYFARAFGFEVIGFAQPEPGKDPSAGELAELVDLVRSANVPAVFSEAGVSSRLAETLAREAGVSKVVTDLPTDSLLQPPADSFIGLMRSTAEKIASALR